MIPPANLAHQNDARPSQNKQRKTLLIDMEVLHAGTRELTLASSTTGLG